MNTEIMRIRSPSWTLENQILFRDKLASKYKFISITDWYSLKGKHFEESNGRGLLHGTYNGSVYKFICSVFPDEEWLPWLFTQTPNGFWHNKENVKWYCTWLSNKKRFTSMDDWYTITQKDFRDNCGMGLQRMYNSNIINILKNAYPDVTWLNWKFKITTRCYFKNIDNQRLFISYIEKMENITKPSDWYNYTAKIIESYGGSGLGNSYHHSLSRLLKVIYPSYEFKDYKFKKVPIQYWNYKYNIQLYLNDLFIELKYSTTEDWYKTTNSDFINYHGNGLLCKFNCDSKRIIMENIEYTWNPKKFIKNGYSRISIEWLKYCEIRDATQVQHIGNSDSEYKIPNTKMKVDGYSKSLNKIYEFLGDFYHGNPNTYPSDKFNTLLKKSMNELYNKTMNFMERKRKLGYRIEYIWESDWRRATAAIKKIQRLWCNKKKSINI